MSYLIFVVDMDTENSRYEEGSLEKHLTYLRRWQGTPNHWSVDDDLADAIDTARTYPGKVSVVDEDDNYKILWTSSSWTTRN